MRLNGISKRGVCLIYVFIIIIIIIIVISSVYSQDRGFNGFKGNTMQLFVYETKWTGLRARARPSTRKVTGTLENHQAPAGQ